MTSGFSEESTVQSFVVEKLAGLGWTHVPGHLLDREPSSVLLEDDLVGALVRLNPMVAEQPSRVDEVLRPLKAAILSARTQGLVAVNEELTRWLRGNQTVKFVGTDKHVPVCLIDFDDVTNNRFVVSGPGMGHVGRQAEVQYPKLSVQGGSAFDVVLWVNGMPLVVGETKSPSSQWSWLNGANDVHAHYEKKHPAFFATNLLSFATEGKEFHYGSVGQPGEKWLQWGHTTDPLQLPPMRRVERSVELLLTPERLLSVLADFVLFDRPLMEGGRRLIKLVPRYPQVEAVEAIVGRVLTDGKDRGLIWHYQGSGKTLAMAYAALKLLKTPETAGSTVICVFDRVDLITQSARQFKSALPDEVAVKVAANIAELRRMLAEDERGLILTTIFRFKDAAELNTRSNVIVMVDEAHRTNEGRLGDDMRRALPNAQFFGLTGTPIATDDRNTFKLFGDPDDDGFVLNRYSQARSIRDGTTVPIHVEARQLKWHLDSDALDEAYRQMAEAEGLSEAQMEMLARKATRAGVVLANPQRTRAICEDIVEHYTTRIAPSGMKAQVVVYDRTSCVAYYEQLRAICAERGLPYEAAIVMTTGAGSKADPEPDEWQDRFGLTDEQEEQLKARFQNPNDPLTFLIVTAKLLTGFDAPIEGVLYLDKPLKLHSLSQTMARVNRRWTHPETRHEKAHGLIVDYIGLGNELKQAIRDAQPETADDSDVEQPSVDVEGLAEQLTQALTRTLSPRFDGIDRTDNTFNTLMQAQQRLATDDQLTAFATDMVTVTTLWEFLDPLPVLAPHKADYRWLAQVYESVKPTTATDAMLWRRLGPKTIDLVHQHMTIEGVEQVAHEVILDDETIEAIRQLAEQDELDLGLTSTTNDDEADDGPHTITVEDALATVARRLTRLADDNDHAVFHGLSDRLQKLRDRHISDAASSQQFLEELLQLTTDVLKADRAVREGNLDDVADTILDPRIGALTQIFEENAPDDTPVIVRNVVRDIDTLVKQVAFPGWATSHQGERDVKRELRLLLKDKYGLPPSGGLFDKAYAYIVENY